MSTNMPAIRPKLLSWARETAGLSLADAARLIGLNDAHGETGANRLASFENGQGEPTRPQLLQMAKKYRRSLLTFYLSEPPPKGQRGEDFRTLPDQQTGYLQPLLDALLRDVKTRQSIVRSTIEDDPDARRLTYVGSMRLNDGVPKVSDAIRTMLQFSLKEFRSRRSVEAAFGYLRERVESLGIFVLLIGNLGSHHTNVDVTEFRGFALADDLAPFVVINDQDARTAWAFTLLHEVAHLWLGASGVSGLYGESHVERFCNDVASGLLLEANELSVLDIDNSSDEDEISKAISDFAKPRHISRSMIAYRLFRAGMIPQITWWSVVSRFKKEWLDRRKSERQQSEGGPSYYTIRQHRLGAGLLKFVEHSINDGGLSPTKAGLVLGVKLRSVWPLLSTLHRKAS